MPRPYLTIETYHVGRPAIEAFGRSWTCSSFIGRILPGDVGKRIYLTDDNTGRGFLQVENDAQRLERHQREATEAMQALGAGDVVHMSSAPWTCAACGSTSVARCGFLHGPQTYRCADCGAEWSA